MKLLAWNLGHQTIERPVVPMFFDAILELSPDLVALNEYVHGDSRQSLLEGLARAGLSHVLISERRGKNNQVLIACRYPIVAGDLRAPRSPNGASESNFLHVIVPATALEVVGVRAPSYLGAELVSYWEQLAAVIRGTKQRRIVFIGDLNTDPDATRRSTSNYLRSLRDEGWKIPSPSGAWSFVAGTRIDHAVASASVDIVDAQYIAALGERTFASNDRATRISDHAALVVHVVSVASAA